MYTTVTNSLKPVSTTLPNAAFQDPGVPSFAFGCPSPENEQVFIAFWNSQLKTHINKDLQVENCVDKGSQSCVFKLRNTKTGEASVLKVLNQPDAQSYFDPKHGPSLLLNIRHPNICSPTHLLYLTNENTFSLIPCSTSKLAAMVMPYVEGDALSRKMGAIAEQLERLFNFGLLLATTLAELHEYGIAHCDFNRNNIRVTREWRPILIDFDTAVRISADSPLDYPYLQDHLIKLIQYSRDIKPQAEKFLLTRCEITSLELPMLSQRMIALMLGCLDHINAISRQSAEAFDQGRLEMSIQRHFEAFKKTPTVASTTETQSNKTESKTKPDDTERTSETQKIRTFLLAKGIDQSRIHIGETLQENANGMYRTIFVDDLDYMKLGAYLQEYLKDRPFGGGGDNKTFLIYED